MIIAGGAGGQQHAAAVAAAGASGQGQGIPALDWKFSQVFGERAANEEVQEGLATTMTPVQNGSICLTGCVGVLLESHFQVGKHIANRRLTTQIGGEWRRVKLRSNRIVCTLNIGQSPDIGNGPQSDGDTGDAPLQTGSTRLGRLIRARQKDLIDKFNSIRKNLPLKIFLLLLGFYSANALATILGQTGDWDVLVAGFLVAVIEGIGIIIYKMPIMEEKFLMVMRLVNYWKAGLTFGLFVDAFKLGS